MTNEMDTPHPERDLLDVEIEVDLDLEFLRSNPSPEVAMRYALDQLRQAATRDTGRG